MSLEQRLGQNIVITDASCAIGLGTARMTAKARAAVIAAARNEQALPTVADETSYMARIPSTNDIDVTQPSEA